MSDGLKGFNISTLEMEKKKSELEIYTGIELETTEVNARSQR